MYVESNILSNLIYTSHLDSTYEAVTELILK